MKNVTLLVPAMALALMAPFLSNADSWKNESGYGPWNNGVGHAYGHEKHKHKHKKHHKHDHDHDDDKEVIYVYKERPVKEVIYVHEGRPRKEVIYIEDEHPRGEIVYRERSSDDRHARVSTGSTGIERGTCNRKAMGTVMGGFVGGVVGYKIGKNNGDKRIGMLLGALAGAFAGNEIGKNMDEADAQCTAQTLEHARDGQTISWHNPENGVNYKMTPVDSYRKNDLECRRFVSVASSDRQHEKISREACKQADGHWEVAEI